MLRCMGLMASMQSGSTAPAVPHPIDMWTNPVFSYMRTPGTESSEEHCKKAHYKTHTPQRQQGSIL